MEGMHQPNNRMTLMGGVHQLPQISQATKKIGDEGGRAPAPTENSGTDKHLKKRKADIAANEYMMRGARKAPKEIMTRKHDRQI
uniref:Uncharacterized protein n=1 Tax=Amphimedon queenslandica TaxID=400682 RepID=A0A1X7U2K6_AMPQE